MPVRETDFVLFPSLELGGLIARLASERRGKDLAANLVQRAMAVVEESDVGGARVLKRREFQSVVYQQAVAQVSEGNYSLFRIFNERDLHAISPKLPDLVRGLLLQPLIRLTVYNKNIPLDPNRVMEMTGVVGFKKIFSLFSLNVSELNFQHLDSLLNSMRSRTLHHAFVSVFLSVASGVRSVRSPVVPRSRWTVERVVMEILKKRNSGLLCEVLAGVSPGVRREIFDLLIARHVLTGMPKHPWALEWVASGGEGWEVTAPLDDAHAPLDALLEAPLEAPAQSPPHTAPSREARSFLISTPGNLHVVKSALQEEAIVGLSFVCESLLSVSGSTESFLIDLKTVPHQFVTALLKQLLSDAARAKVVYSLGAFLNAIQSLAEGGVHFENLIDLRLARIRRSEEWIETERVDFHATGIPALDRKSGESVPQYREKVEHFPPSARLADLVREHLQDSHDRHLAQLGDEWEIRPLSAALLEFAACDSHHLVRVEKALRARRIFPTEILSFDPFR